MRFMQRALQLAAKGRGLTAPNPMVGAVFVRGGKIIAEGWHRKAGGPHAEIVAMKKLQSETLKGAQLYVTLEPCCHIGKTGPCAPEIVRAGIDKVFVGMRDPFSKVNGRGINFLRKNGVAVEILAKGTPLAREIRELNKFFLKHTQIGLPYVILKAGMSLDGKITSAAGQSKWITGEKARLDARRERSFCDAVLIGGGTLKADNPTLNAFGGKRLRKIVLAGELNFDLKSHIFKSDNVVIFCFGKKDASAASRLENIGVKVIFVSVNRVVPDVLNHLAKLGVQSVFVEGGAYVHGLFFDAFLKNRKYLDEVLFYISPKILGGRDALAAIGGRGVQELSKAAQFRQLSCELVGGNFKMRGIFTEY